jgi:cytochrome c oxidase accessory protein FixG
MNQLDPGKLTSVDEHGDRIWIIPAEVRGYFRRHRNWTQLILLAIFLLIPWTTFRGHQTVLIDVPDREFALFGVLFKAHDTPLLFFILAVAALSLAFVTSVWGRVWCGWACPQTVFIDSVYRRIEQWIEGNYLKRRQLRDGPMTFEKLWKTSLKWLAFIFVSSLIAHSFMAYFIGAKELIAMTQKAPEENPSYFILVTFFTALFAFDFGWFREQFCVIMCPYGRIQSVLLDNKSLALVYDTTRGEPRKSLAQAGQKSGDCVACNRCVQVCPTGIDIRNGLQMECIACTACADACDEIMTKLKKPTGLIGYKTLDGSPISLKKTRSILYILLIFALVGGLVYSLSTRQPFYWTLLRNQGSPYSLIKNESNQEIVLNQFHVHIHNQSGKKTQYELKLVGLDEIELNVAEPKITLLPGESRNWFLFTKIFPQKIATGQLKGTLEISAQDEEEVVKATREITILGPHQ